jgi:hypothetical protein
VVIITRRGESPEGGIYWVLEWRGLITNRALREIQNYRNGRKTRENIPFEIKKMIDPKGMDSEGMEGKHRKIFGSKWKVLISKGQTYTFGTDSVGKYSVQNWEVLISNGQTYMFGTDSVGKY